MYKFLFCTYTSDEVYKYLYKKYNLDPNKGFISWLSEQITKGEIQKVNYK